LSKFLPNLSAVGADPRRRRVIASGDYLRQALLGVSMGNLLTRMK